MSYIKTITVEQATGAAHEMYEHQKQHWGYVPNYAKTFGYRPELMSRWGRLLAEARRPVDDYRYELVTFAAANRLGHTACSLAHGGKLANMIGTESVTAIADGRESDVLSDADVAIVRFARSVAEDARQVSPEQVDALRTQFGLDEADIFDIASIAAARCFFTKILDALGSKPDDPLLASNQELTNHLLK